MNIWLNRASLKRLFYLIVVACATFYLQRNIHTSQSLWLVTPAFLFALIALQDVFPRRLIFFILVGFATIVVATCGAGVPFPLSAFYLFAVTVVCVYLGQLYPDYFLAVFAVNVFAVLSASVPLASSSLMERGLLIFMGVATAVIAQVFLWPYFVRDELHFFLDKSLWHLQLLNREIFACFLQPEYTENVYLYERRLHNQKNKYIQAIVKARCFAARRAVNMPAEKASHLNALLAKIDLIYDTLLDCSQLRRRVSDFTIFAVCSQELTALLQAIENTFTVLRKQEKCIDCLSDIDEKIYQFESLNQTILQVTAREPLVFLLFIGGLKALRAELQACDDMYARQV